MLKVTGLLQEIIDEVSKAQSPPLPQELRFVFDLERDEHGFSDQSWSDIVDKGQALQRPYWERAESEWSRKYPMPGDGWHGSSAMPVIMIRCQEPEYRFHRTISLPGRFHLDCPTRWGSMLRFMGDEGPSLMDTVAYGTKTNAAVGLYVMPTTVVGGMTVRPFEQTVSNVTLVAHNGVLPVYLAQNQDRLRFDTVKILQHLGANIGIKHGPPISRKDQCPGGNVWLTDPVFQDLQMEGPHNNQRPQAAMLVCGANILINNLNLYGWMQGPYLHDARNSVVTNILHHSGKTGDGRQFCSPSEIVSLTICTTDETNEVGNVAGEHRVTVLPKRSRVKLTGGWHKRGEIYL